MAQWENLDYETVVVKEEVIIGYEKSLSKEACFNFFSISVSKLFWPQDPLLRITPINISSPIEEHWVRLWLA